MGQKYLLGCPPGGESRLLEAAQRVDATMCRIRDAGRVRARERIAVLAALNLAFETPRQEQPATAPPVEPVAVQSSDGVTAADQQALAALVQRLDQALADDGPLP